MTDTLSQHSWGYRGINSPDNGACLFVALASIRYTNKDDFIGGELSLLGKKQTVFEALKLSRNYLGRKLSRDNGLRESWVPLPVE